MRISSGELLLEEITHPLSPLEKQDALLISLKAAAEQKSLVRDRWTVVLSDLESKMASASGESSQEALCSSFERGAGSSSFCHTRASKPRNQPGEDIEAATILAGKR